jgi:hypothetical protein
MLSDAVLLTPANVAVIVEEPDATAPAVTTKVAVVAPAGTVTDAGRDTTAEFDLTRATTTPAGPAFPTRVTVPMAVAPETIDVPGKLRLERTGASTVKPAETDPLP